jgi:hypothetical protein
MITRGSEGNGVIQITLNEDLSTDPVVEEPTDPGVTDPTVPVVEEPTDPVVIDPTMPVVEEPTDPDVTDPTVPDVIDPTDPVVEVEEPTTPVTPTTPTTPPVVVGKKPVLPTLTSDLTPGVHLIDPLIPDLLDSGVSATGGGGADDVLQIVLSEQQVIDETTETLNAEGAVFSSQQVVKLPQDQIFTAARQKKIISIIKALWDNNRPTAEFILGVLYEYVYSNLAAASDAGAAVHGALRGDLKVFLRGLQFKDEAATMLEERLPNSTAFKVGRIAGGVGAIAQGIIEFLAGFTIAGAGAVAETGTGGVATPVAVPVAIGGSVLALHGGILATVAAHDTGGLLREVAGVFFSKGNTGGTSPQKQSKLDGDDFEKKVSDALREPINTKKVTGKVGGKPRNTEPDLNTPRTGVVDIKNEKDIGFTPQLKAQHDYAVNNGKTFSLIIGPKTNSIAKSLQTAINQTGGKIFRYDPVTGNFSNVRFDLKFPNRVLP